MEAVRQPFEYSVELTGVYIKKQTVGFGIRETLSALLFLSKKWKR